MSITSGPVWIPLFSAVDKHDHVLTWVHLGLNLERNGQPVSGMYVPLKSSRGEKDTISDDQATNNDGIAGASVSTRDQPGNSTISSASSTIETAEAANITWFPAQYQNSFLLTCYVIASESDWVNTKLVTAPGIPGKKYHQGFLKDTKLQGTGEALDGTYIHYIGNGRYMLLPTTCAPTRTGACAVDGVTAAVDPSVIPLKSTIDISVQGLRVALDTGGGINGYHIDLFYGTRRKACLSEIGKSPGHSVTLQSYGN